MDNEEKELDPFLIERYGLDTEDLQWLYYELDGLVDVALEQFEKGYAVDVESVMAGLAKAMVERLGK